MKRRTQLIVEVPAGELAVRIAEAFLSLRRPEGVSAEQLLAALDPETRQNWLRAAKAAMMFFAECTSRGGRPH